MCAMFGWLSAARTSASRRNRASRSESPASESGRTLIATSRFRSVSTARIHLAHAARAEQGDDLVDADASARSEAHGYFVGTRRFSSSNQFCTICTCADGARTRDVSRAGVVSARNLPFGVTS